MKDKIPLYEIVNMFFTGTVFTIAVFVLLYGRIQISDDIYVLIEYLEKWSVIVGTGALVLMYEIGFVLSKLGAITLGYILPKLKIWPHDSYSIDVSKLEAENANFKTMNTELHVVRTHIVMCILLSIVAVLVSNWIGVIVCVCLVFVFVFSGRRTNAFMNQIKKDYSQEHKKPMKFSTAVVKRIHVIKHIK